MSSWNPRQLLCSEEGGSSEQGTRKGSQDGDSGPARRWGERGSQGLRGPWSIDHHLLLGSSLEIPGQVEGATAPLTPKPQSLMSLPDFHHHCSFVHSIIHSFTPSLIHSVVHSLPPSLNSLA